jgi:hypothetical protein
MYVWAWRPRKAGGDYGGATGYGELVEGGMDIEDGARSDAERPPEIKRDDSPS